MGVVLPLVLPPGKLFVSEDDHLLKILDLVILSLPGVVHLFDDSPVVLLLRHDFSSLLMDLVDLLLEVDNEVVEVFVVLLSVVDKGFLALNIFLSGEDVLLEFHVLSDLLHQLVDQAAAFLDAFLVLVDEVLEGFLELRYFLGGGAVSELGGKLGLLLKEFDNFLVLVFDLTDVIGGEGVEESFLSLGVHQVDVALDVVDAG